jgi:undecaprenyl-diphosphatase
VLLLIGVPLMSRPLRWLSSVAAGLVVLAVGFARVGLGVHYLSDVLAGWILGLGWLAATVAAFHAWRQDVGASVPDVAEGLEPEIAAGRGVRRGRYG